MNFCDIKKLLLAALFTSAIFSHSAMASYISDGSSGEFHPLFDTTLDLSGPANFPQFSNIYIDSGIHITVRTPDIGYGYLLSADGIYLNGFLDAGTGSLSLNAINSIVMGNGSQLIGHNLGIFFMSNVAISGTIQLTGVGAFSAPDRSQPLSGSITIQNGSGGVMVFNGGEVVSSGGSINLTGGGLSLFAPVPLPAASILLGSGLLGLLSFGTGSRRC